MAARSKSQKPKWQSSLEAKAIDALFRYPRVLPYGVRRDAAAWVFSRIVSPVAGYDKRIADNLRLAIPDISDADVKTLTRTVPANVGRMLTELAAGDAFLDQLRGEPLQGPGVAAIEEAKGAKRPILIVSGHFGNFDAMRGALALNGHNIGAVYRPLDDPRLEQAFHAMLTKIASPVFPRGRQGLAQMIRHLRQGGAVAILIDQFVHGAQPVNFFGRPVPTSLSAAELTLRYDGLMVPVYGIRRPDRRFDLIVEDPIPHSDPITMTQAANDSLEARIRANMDQWLWIHRRWKEDRSGGRRPLNV